MNSKKKELELIKSEVNGLKKLPTSFEFVFQFAHGLLELDLNFVVIFGVKIRFDLKKHVSITESEKRIPVVVLSCGR